MQYESFILVYVSKSKTSIRGIEVNCLGRTPFAEKNEKRHLSLAASADYLLQRYRIFFVQASIFSNVGYDFGDAAGGVLGRGGKSGALQLECSLSLYSEFLTAKACRLSSQTLSWRKSVALKSVTCNCWYTSHVSERPCHTGAMRRMVGASLRPSPSSKKTFSSKPLQQVPIVYYTDKNRCHTSFLARLTWDHMINTFQLLLSQARFESAACTAKGSLQSSLLGWKGSEQGLFSLQLCKIVNHQQYASSANLVGYPAPDFFFFLVGFSFIAEQELLWE